MGNWCCAGKGAFTGRERVCVEWMAGMHEMPLSPRKTRGNGQQGDTGPDDVTSSMFDGQTKTPKRKHGFEKWKSALKERR